MAWLINPRSLAFVILPLVICASRAEGQRTDGFFAVNRGRTLLDAHNCYPYEGRWSDRIDRALKTGFPVAIEQDLAWYVDPATRLGRIVVSHQAKTNGTEPTLREYFFERVRPIMEDALRKSNRNEWPLVVVHFDFKDNQEPLLRAVWKLLGEYQNWITTAQKGHNPHQLSPLAVKPLLVLTEDPDAQERVFFDDVPEGSPLLLFGSAHTHVPAASNHQEQERLLVTTTPEQLLSDPPTNYRRWWNNSWHVVEEGGQTRAAAWSDADAARLKALVGRAHELGYWIRFFTLDGFDVAVGRENGWLATYNFGTADAVRQRWAAAIAAGVDMLATDQYEDLRGFLNSGSR